jgi:hypothetical protein
MYPEPQLPPDTHRATPKRNPFRRRRAAEPPERPSGLLVQSLDRCVDVAAVVNHPLIGVLMTEDFCWRAASSAGRNVPMLPGLQALRLSSRAIRRRAAFTDREPERPFVLTAKCHPALSRHPRPAQTD